MKIKLNIEGSNLMILKKSINNNPKFNLNSKRFKKKTIIFELLSFKIF